MPISNLHQLFEHELSDLHSVETQIIAALPKMIQATTDDKLRTALQDHLDVTKKQLSRLNQIKNEVPYTQGSMVCEGMKGILTEGDKSLKEIDDAATKDAAIIAGAQRVEHYEMSVYGTAVEYAHKLGYGDVADLLQQTLDEEKKADADLNGLAKGGLFTEGLNEEAMDE